MPELPEVETVRQTLIKQIVGKKIVKVDVYYEGITTNPEELKAKLPGQILVNILRKGKYLLFIFNKGSMISHLRMEGKYFIKPLDAPKEKHEHVIFTFDDGLTWRYHDTRKFGRMTYVDSINIDVILANPSLSKLGPDANSPVFTTEYLFNALKERTTPIKTALLDQELVAGLGNIYVDEVCFTSKINPCLNARYISYNKCEQIVASSKNILTRAIAKGGTTIRSYTSSLGVTGLFQLDLLVHDKEDEPCPICHTIIKKTQVGGRGTYYCPSCQPIPRMIIGITGGIASGKSSVTTYLKSLHYPVIDCDEIVHSLLHDPKIIKEIITMFGEEYLNNEKEIDRVKLAKLIYNNGLAKSQLESFLHPLVRKIINKQKDEYLLHPIVFIDIPLLFEAHFDNEVEQIILIYIDKETQIKRLKERDSIDNEQALLRIKAQMPLDEKKKLANYIIDNSNDLCYTYQEIDKTIKKIKNIVKQKGEEYGN